VAGLLSVGLLASGLASAALLTAPAAQAAPGDAFDPRDPLVFVGQGIPTRLYQAVTDSSGKVSFEGEGPTANLQYNSISYNTADNYVYGLTNSAGGGIPVGALIRIGQEGVITRVGTNTFGSFNVGAFGPSNYLYVNQGTTTAMSVINVATGALVRTITLNQRTNAADLAYANGFFWGLTSNNNSSTSTPSIVRVNPTNGAVNFFAAPVPLANTDAGAAWTFGNGNLGFSSNGSGVVSQIAVTNPASASPTFRLVSQSAGPSSGNNDGAASPGLPTDLSIAKTGPETLVEGSTVTYTLTVTNNGPGNSSGFVVNDAVPAPLTNVTTASPGCTVTGNAVRCVGGRLVAGASASFTVMATVPGTANGAVQNTATVTANETDPNPANNTATTTGTPVPLVTCTSDPNIFNTGFDAATGRVLPNNAKDASWQVAGRYAAGAGVSMPPANAVWAAANVGNMAPGSWAASPYGNAQWISQQTIASPSQGGVSGDWYYRLQFLLDDEVDPAQFALAMNFLADNAVAEVFVNGQPQSGKTTGLPQFPLGPAVSGQAPYWSPGFQLANAAQTTLNHDWQTGLNTIIVQVKSGPDAEGFDAQVRPSVLCPVPALSLTKTAGTPVDVNGNGITDAGDTIQYTFVATNSGEAPLSDLVIDDPKVGAIACDTTAIGVGERTTCETTEPYVVTAADVAAGAVVNTATATATTPRGTGITSDPSTTSTPTEASAPALTVIKTATPADADSFVAGQQITYSFLVTNVGNVPVADVAIDEGEFTGSGELPPAACEDSRLEVGGQTTCTTTYTLTQADVDAGSVTNSATATGTPVGSDTPIDSPPSETTVPVPADPAISVLKSVSPATAGRAGQEITYYFQATNTGTVTLTDVSVTEGDFTGTGELSPLDCPAAEAASLAPGATVTCTATYTLTQADVDDGQVTNAATATGTPPTGDPVTSTPSTATVTSPPAPALTVVKSADATEITQAGQEVAYSFVVTNTGNVTLDDVAVDEGEFSGAGDPPAVECPAGPLAPAESVTCAATYVVTQADLDAAEPLSNTATATGTPPTGDPVDSPPSAVELPVAAEPALTVVKTADAGRITEAGQQVSYRFVVTNTGNVTLRDVAVDDRDFTGTGDPLALECPADTIIAPTETVTCAATYVVTQADVDAGTLTNTATAHGTPPGSDTPVPSEPWTVDVPVDARPALEVVKTADVDDVPAAGETVTYSFEVTNTGNVTMRDVTVEEGDFTGTGTMSAVRCPDDATLAPDASLTCTATYEVTQADVDAGRLTNTATATGTPPGSDTPVPSEPSTVKVPADPAPALTVAKTADVEEITAAGQTVTYSFEVANTGNVTITDPKVTETAFSGTGELSPIVCPTAPIAPGDAAVCTATYEVTQADVDSGELSNTATVTGTPPGDTPPPVSPPSSVEIPVDPRPALEVDKSADLTDPAELTVGRTVTYIFDVTNTGNQTLTDVTISEGAFSGAGELSAIDCPAEGVATLAPGQTVTCTATYVVTQADVDAGQISNTATATGTPPSGDPVDSPPSTVEVPADPQPALEVVKTADVERITAAGQTVTYSFEVTNTGNVTITDPRVTEGEFSGTGDLSAVECPGGPLAPRDAVTCTATYVVTQADVDSGALSNTATVTGTPPGGTPPPVSPPSTVEVPADPQPALEVVKTADVERITAAGQTVTYSFEVTNTGNVTVTDPRVTEGDFSGTGDLSAVECPADASLAPGESVTCTATYEVTQADVDSGALTNTASAGGTTPSGDPVPPSEPSTVEIPVDPRPGLSVVKSADVTADEFAAGQAVTYTFVVTNTGNQTLTGVAVDEGEFSGTGDLSALDCPADGLATLAPGAQVTCEATYVLTQADVDAGRVTNTATATGTPPAGDPVPSEPSTVQVPVDPQPGVAVVKTADVGEISAPGQTVTYAFAVTNTGNVSLTDVAVDEGAFSGTGELSPLECPEQTAGLPPGQTVTCTATYVTTQADVDAGSLTNTATAGARPPSGDPITSDPSTAEVGVDAQPALEVVKTADVAEVSEAGQVVTYTFVATNTGNLTISDALVQDDDFTGHGDLSAVECAGGTTLTPGESVACTATYRVVAADLTDGKLSNTAVVTGTTPDGDQVTSEPSTVTVETVAPADGGGSLPRTGVMVGGIVGAAALLLGLGLLAMRVARRRTQG
jgi:uncharacterized repeat protein (TIGR01451 family)